MLGNRLQEFAYASAVRLTKYVYVAMLAAATLILLGNLGRVPVPVHFEAFYFSRALKLALYSGLVGAGWLWIRNTRDTWYLNLGTALLHVGGLALLFRVEGLGDEYFWRDWVSAGNRLPGSEILAIFVYRVGHLLAFPLERIAPIAGFLLLFLVLQAAKRLEAAFGAQHSLRPATYLFYAASPISFLFLPGYVENAFLCLPALWLALVHLVRFSGREARDRSLYWAAFWFAVSGCFHGVSVSLLPLLPIACILRLRREPSWARLAARVGRCLLIGSAVVGAVFVSLHLAGFTVVDMNGGQDNSFVELRMFTKGHARIVATIFFVTMPGFFLWAPYFLKVIWPAMQRELEPYVLLLAAILGFYCFGSLFGFDLGYPMDFDLMMPLGITIPLFLSALTAGLGDRPEIVRRLGWFALANGLITWWSLAPIFRAGLLFRLWS